MKITQIKPFLVDRFLLVRVYTDEGVIGNGEAGLWSSHKAVYHMIEELSD
jgi:L-alanine-DL-glutamate epimerase-like enolase superfamily enzyme